MAKISYAEVRQQVSLQRVLDLLGYAWLVRHRTTVRGPCPLKCCAAARCCAFDLGRNLWNCHHCKRGGNQLDLFAEVRRLSLYPAAVELCQRAGVMVPYLVHPTSVRPDRGCP